MNRNFVTFLFIFLFSQGLISGQDEATFDLFLKYFEFYNSADFTHAEAVMLLVLDPKTNASPIYIAAAYNNLGIINKNFGKYTEALMYYDKAESWYNDLGDHPRDLATIYSNRALIYTIQKSYGSAIEYLEKAIRIYNNLIDEKNTTLYQSISAAYLNLGIAHYELKNLKKAEDYFNRSAELKQMHNLSGLALVYLNIAKTFVRIGNSKKAEEFFLKSISSFIKESGYENYRLVDVYFDYGLLLRSIGKTAESLEILKKASSICIKNYGEKHTFVSLSYRLIGDHFKNISDYTTALEYYQKALIAVTNNFNNSDIFVNPSIDSALFDIRLLDNLKSKAQALELFASQQNDPGLKLKAMGKSLGTIELGLKLIDRIRNNYMSEESRIYLAENEKETYLFATQIASSLYSAIHEDSLGYQIYGIAQKAKAAVLRNEIAGNELLYSAGVPDSLREKQTGLSGNIAAYNNLILEENRKAKPDSSKISMWKDALFDMNREKEKVTDVIEKVFPQYHDLIRRTEPVSLQLIQKHLKKDETIVDYLLSNQYSGGTRKLYIFIISRDHLDFRENRLDSVFVQNAEILRKTSDPSGPAGLQNYSYSSYTGALNYMYLNLIKPVEELFKGKKLIIIPDEEIGWLPFDAFLRVKPTAGQNDYEGLHYLINNYTFSYGYSSSLILGRSSKILKGIKVFAFSPGYDNNALSGKPLSSLQGAGKEIESVHKWFGGQNFSGENATKANFITTLSEPAVFHLAMHSMSDSTNSKYSYLIFDTHNISPDSGKLFNYEISLSRIKSPMVVLSACNSGSGTLYHGEGLMSLARGFSLAGASSVIKTAWSVNDEASAGIISLFYQYLSKGKEKNEAMRLAKLGYMKEHPPSFSNPYYWAAYEVLGDNSPIARDSTGIVLIIACMVAIIASLLFYFKRRNIFSDGSL